MPTLNWIGKDAVVKHHKDVPYRLLEPVPELSCGDADSGNLIVQGDNLHALKALLPRYAGQVKCIYIDPPYNTGNEGWVYNDNVNSPEIRKWLHDTVGKEGEDLSRHDKWLCMMYPRLVLLKQFLSKDGAIFISIDDNELATLKLLMDEIFGRRNFVANIVWKNATDNNPTNIAPEHEYIACYCREKSELEQVWKASNLSAKSLLLDVEHQILSEAETDKQALEKYREWLKENKPYIWPFQDYKFIDEHGIYTGIRGVHNPGKEGYRYPVLHPLTGKACKEPLMGYRFPEETMQQLIADDRIIFGEDESKIIELKVYVRDYKAKFSSVFDLDGRAGTNEIKALFPESKRAFNYPKSLGLIEQIISFASDSDSLIMDSFAGSGTTAHAVLKQNVEDGGNRKFILVEMDKQIAQDVTVERVRRVANGYKNAKGEPAEGLGGGFQYCTLSDEPLFDATGAVREDVRFDQLAEFVWFSETGSGFFGRTDTPLIGVDTENRGIYLLYNGILKDRSPDGGNVLTAKVLDMLPRHDGPKVIYAAACRLSKKRLADAGIVFKQTPYALEV